MRRAPRSAPALGLLGAVLLGCPGELAVAPCAVRSDCARDERCAPDGRCVPTTAPARRPGTSQPSVDAGFTPPVDAGVERPDAGPGCPNVQVVGGASFCTIGEAVAAAPTGGVVRIPAGVYAERVRLDRRVELRGAGPTTVLRPTGAEPVIQVAASGSLISNLAVRADEARAFQIGASSTLEVVTVQSARGAGVAITGTATVQLTSVSILGVAATGGGDDDGAGLSMGTSNVVTMSQGRIEGCAGPGVRIRGGRLGMTGVQVLSSAAGIVADGDARLDLSSTRLERHRGSGLYQSGGSLAMLNSSASENGSGGADRHGLRLEAGTVASVQGSDFRANDGQGMFCAASVRPNPCLSNTCSGNGLGPTNCVGCTCQ